MSLCGFVVQAADRATPVRLTLPTAALVVREAVAHALFLGLSPLGRGQPDPPLVGADASQERRPPVLLLPGHRTNRSALWFLNTFLLQRGWNAVWPASWAGRNPSLAVRAQQVAARVESLRRATGATRVDVVAFSAGGLAAAWYLRHLEGQTGVRRLVTIGTPWRGTRMAVFARGEAGHELLHGSHLLDDLTPVAVPTLCIWSPDDPMVVPATSASVPGCQNVVIEGAGHMEMLLSARVFRAVQEALSHPLPESVA